jgi:hypothetical protein
MKHSLLIAVIICVESISAQVNLWQYAIRRENAGDKPYIEKTIHPVKLSQAQRKSLFRILKARKDVLSCPP